MILYQFEMLIEAVQCNFLTNHLLQDDKVTSHSDLQIVYYL